MEQKAEEYLNKQYVDYGDLNHKAEQQIKQAFIEGMKEQLRIAVVMPSACNFYMSGMDTSGKCNNCGKPEHLH